jgi:integrase
MATKAKAEVYPFTVEALREVVTRLEERAPGQGSLALVLGLTGLRWGEFVALRVRDVVAVPYPALRVSRSGPDGQEIRTSTKGGVGRTVPIPAEVAPIVTAWAKGKGPDDLLFTTGEGHRLINSNWRRIVDWRSHCQGRRVHDLRHTAATIWLGMGVDVKTVQGWLGHQSAQLTLDLYGHFRGTDADTAALARVNAALSGNASGTPVANLGTHKRSTSQ